ncbi:MAG TPA: hypothetical protein VGX23_34380 [Actinocrinis sp.]|nr:hypothetical protein [Actinocrinis sp.]
MIYVILLVAIVAVMGLAVAGTVVAARHKDRLETFATSRGWALLPPDKSLSRLSVGEPFQVAARNGVRAVLRGYFQGHQAAVFDYTYTTSTSPYARPNGQYVRSKGRYDRSKGPYAGTYNLFSHSFSGSQIQRRWVAALPGLPRLQVAPRTGLIRTPHSYGMRLLKTGEPQFDSRFTVYTDNPPWALALLGSGLGGYLLAGPARPWRIDGQVILTWQRGRVDPAQIEAVLRHLAAIAGQAAGVPAG